MIKKDIELLKTLVSIPSYVGNNNPHFEFRISAFLVGYFKKNFPNFSVKIQPFEKKRVNLLFQNDKEIKILFACHMDTVPPSTGDAFKLKVKGVKAYGLGTKDMKGGIVSTLIALREVFKHKGIGILFYGDEETNFKGINKVVCESKNLFKKSPRLIISPESRFNLGVGARGIAVFEVSITGKKAHSARPHLGVDAIKNFVGSIESLEENLNRRESQLGKTSIAIPWIEGGLLQGGGKIGYHIGTIPDYVTALVSVRNSKPKLDGNDILQLLKKEGARRGIKIKGKILEDYPARVTSRVVVSKVSKIVKRATGTSAEIGDPKLAGFNDVSILGKKLNSPVVNFGPYGEGNHTAEEWVSLNSLTKTAKVFVELVKEYAK